MTVIAKPRRKLLPCGHASVTVHPRTTSFDKWCPVCRNFFTVTVTRGHYGGWIPTIVPNPNLTRSTRGKAS